ncbi:phosphate acetyltransferase [Haloferula luteola]|uniref:Phosphate acetyltransferase n=1 Tax=Haloferula luteola TaxID=595692 RepID=A0A840VES9_9BACT|nr:phosphate acetyltransferase [Haloferula luteola]MBB5352339.1 phosphate acetyltransferase [Haloferula luteola]
MPKHTFLTVPVGRNVGLTSVSIGLVRALDRLGVDVGFFKALGQPHPAEEFDRSSAYLEATTTLTPPEPIPNATVRKAMSKDEIDDLMEEVVSRYETLPAHHDVIIVEGLVHTHDLPQATRLNAALARALNAEVVLVTVPEAPTVDAIASQLDDTLRQLPDHFRRIKPAVLLNHVPAPELAAALETTADSPSLLTALQEHLAGSSGDYEVIGVVPDHPDLAAPRVCDVVDLLNGTIVLPGDMARRRIKKISLCARTVPNMLQALRSGNLIVTPSDRSDIILAAAHAATRSIQLAGLVLTSEMDPDPRVMRFCQDAFELDGGLPIIRVPDSSFEIARRLYDLNPELPVQDVERIGQVMDAIARSTDANWLRHRCATHVAKRLSPPAFRHRISKTARTRLKRIVLPEGEETRTVQAAVRCAERGIARCVLIGDPQQILEVARVNNLQLPPLIEILDPEPERDRFLAPLLELRKGKNLTETAAREALRDNVVFATMMLAMDEVDGLVSGAVHSTADTIRPALQLIRTAPDAKAVSSVFFMCLPDQVLVYGDCAVNPDPDAETLADIAIQSAQSAKSFGIDPIVAMISYSTLGSGAGSDVEKVRQATEIARQRAPELIIDGPLQYDAATIAEVAATKAPDSKVAGRANVFIFPDLNTGNTTYKAVQRSANVISMGPMLQGLRKPVNDLSRGATVDDILYTIALTAVQAQ